jgi:arylsulfatase A-like enzyme
VSPPSAAVVSIAGMNGPNGAWAQTHGSSFATVTALNLSVDEDQTSDSEREHTAEQVAYLAFGAPQDNDPPVATEDAAATLEDTPTAIAVLANDGDPDGDALSVASVTTPANGSAAIAGASVTYTPRADFCGADGFGYTASDGRGGTAAASVSVTVGCVNDPPTARNDSVSVDAGASASVAVLANDGDVDSPSLAVSAVTQGQSGSVTTDGVAVTYAHDGSSSTSDSFSYTVSDGAGGTSTASVAVSVRQATAGRPNILLMIADDVGIDVLTELYPGLVDAVHGIYSARGHASASNIRGRPASTPALLERIAAQGMVFSSAWAQPVCSPTRAALITGLYAEKTGVTAPGSPLSRNHTTFVELLKSQASYRAALIGKWHLGTNSSGVLPQRAGFDVFRGHSGGALEGFWSYSYHVQDAATTNPDRYRVDPRPTRSLPGIAATSFAPVVQASDAIDTIAAWEADDPDRPWLVWLAFNEAHSPMHVPNADTLDAASFAEVSACGGVPGTSTRGACSDKVLVRAMTNAMDTVIGKVLDAVDAIDPNTYVIFVGDNGTESDSVDNLYLTASGRGKGTVYESGSRVALAIRGPGIAAGSRSGEFVHAVDLYATILEMAGVEVPATNLGSTGAVVDLDSESLLPILRGASTAVRDANEGYVLTETSYLGSKASARNGRYKVVCNGGPSASCGFYDLVSDPLEAYPLARPASCTAYRTSFTTAQASWHYCRLREAIGNAAGF